MMIYAIMAFTTVLLWIGSDIFDVYCSRKKRPMYFTIRVRDENAEQVIEALEESGFDVDKNNVKVWSGWPGGLDLYRQPATPWRRELSVTERTEER